MNNKIKAITIAGMGAVIGTGIGAVVSALIMTNSCSEMIERQEGKCNDLEKKINEMEKKTILTEEAYNALKEDISTVDEGMRSSYEITKEAFGKFSEEFKENKKAIHELTKECVSQITNHTVKSTDAAMEGITKQAEIAMNYIDKASTKVAESVSSTSAKEIRDKRTKERIENERKLIEEIDNDVKELKEEMKSEK